MKLYFHFLTGLLTQNPVNDNEDKAVQDAMTRSDISQQLREVHDKATQIRIRTEEQREWENYLRNNVSGDIFDEDEDS